MAKADCPACGREIGVSCHLRVGAKVHCQHCAEKLIVMRLNPVELESSDDKEWEDEQFDRKESVPRHSSRRVYDPRDADGYAGMDWENDGGMRTGKRTKKRSRNRRRSIKDEL